MELQPVTDSVCVFKMFVLILLYIRAVNRLKDLIAINRMIVMS